MQWLLQSRLQLQINTLCPFFLKYGHYIPCIDELGSSSCRRGILRIAYRLFEGFSRLLIPYCVHGSCSHRSGFHRIHISGKSTWATSRT